MTRRPKKSKINRIFALAAILPLFSFQISEPIPWNQILEQAEEWYGKDEAISIAENMLLFQKDNGGWYKNIDMSQPLTDSEKEQLNVEKSAVSGTTIDNDAGFIQMELLAKVYQQTNSKKFAESVLKGLDYLLNAQYENGGWPQYYPLREGYYSHITFNDGAMIQAMELLRNVSYGKNPYGFVDARRRQRAKMAIEKGLIVILSTQINVDGKLTAWCAQYDKEKLTPAKARAYELPSISGGESVGIIRYLMEIEDPSEEVKHAIESAVAWFREVKIEGIKIVEEKDENLPRGYDRIVVEDKDAGPLWGRFYEIETNRPMFVGRDGIVKYRLSEIEHERRVGYSYLGNYAEDLLEMAYPQWKKRMAAVGRL